MTTINELLDRAEKLNKKIMLENHNKTWLKLQIQFESIMNTIKWKDPIKPQRYTGKCACITCATILAHHGGVIVNRHGSGFLIGSEGYYAYTE